MLLEQQQEYVSSSWITVVIVGVLVLIAGGILFGSISRVLQKSRAEKETFEKLKIHNELLITQNKTLVERLQEVNSSLDHAARIQQAVFPDEILLRQYFNESFLLHLPKEVVSGDFCWVKSVQNKKIIAVGDCTGHGFPGAYISSVVYHCLEKVVGDYGITQLDLLMEELNFYFLETFKYHKRAIIDEGIDIALAAFTEGENTMEFCGARNGYLLVRNGIATPVKATSGGINTKYEYKDIYYSSHQSVQPGDMIYFFSDGFKDQFGGPAGKKYMSRQLHNFLATLAKEADMNKQRLQLQREFENWKGAEPQIDDVIVVGIRI